MPQEPDVACVSVADQKRRAPVVEPGLGVIGKAHDGCAGSDLGRTFRRRRPITVLIDGGQREEVEIFREVSQPLELGICHRVPLREQVREEAAVAQVLHRDARKDGGFPTGENPSLRGQALDEAKCRSPFLDLSVHHLNRLLGLEADGREWQDLMGRRPWALRRWEGPRHFQRGSALRQWRHLHQHRAETLRTTVGVEILDQRRDLRFGQVAGLLAVDDQARSIGQRPRGNREAEGEAARPGPQHVQRHGHDVCELGRVDRCGRGPS